MTTLQCSECGARYSNEEESCAARFNLLLGLDHSRREPWGSRHGQAFAAFALQHPVRFATSLDAAWTALYRIYALNERPAEVLTSLRAAATRAGAPTNVPRRPPLAAMPAITIADLGDFAAEHYAARLDDWCVATLRAYGQAMTWPRRDE